MISNTTWGRVSHGMGALAFVGSFIALKQASRFLTSDSISSGLPQYLLINSIALAILGTTSIISGSKLMKTKKIYEN